MTPASGPSTSNSPAGVTCTLPGSTGKLGRPPGTPRNTGPPTSRTPTRSLSAATVQLPDGSPVEVVVRPGRQLDDRGPLEPGRVRGHRPEPDAVGDVRADGQQVSPGDRRRPEAGAGVAGATAQHGRHGEAAAHGEVRPHSVCGPPQGELVPRAQAQGDARPLGAPRRRQRHGGTGHGDHDVPGRDEPQAAEQDLEAGGAGLVADEPLRERVRSPVERARRSHPPLLAPRPAEVLHQRERPGVEHLESHARHRSTGTKRTRSPGASRAGGSAASSNTDAAVRPSRCQPPGAGRG